MVQLFDSKFDNFSLAEKGQKIKYILNKSVEKPFNEEFTKMVKLPHASKLKFKMNNSLVKELL